MLCGRDSGMCSNFTFVFMRFGNLAECINVSDPAWASSDMFLVTIRVVPFKLSRRRVFRLRPCLRSSSIPKERETFCYFIFSVWAKNVIKLLQWCSNFLSRCSIRVIRFLLQLFILPRDAIRTKCNTLFLFLNDKVLCSVLYSRSVQLTVAWWCQLPPRNLFTIQWEGL